MDIKAAAALLAVFAFIGLIFLGYVLWKQVPLLKKPETKSVKRTRYIMFVMVVIGFLCTVAILAIDIATMLNLARRSTETLNPIGIIYTMTIGVGFMDLSAGFYFIYLMISRDLKSAARLASKNDTLQANNDEFHKKE